MSGGILIVDDDPGFAASLARSLRQTGHDVTVCATAADARAAIDAAHDVVVVDYQLPDADGLALLDELLPRARAGVFVMVTAFPDVEIAVQAMRRGAFDYVTKGTDPRECLIRIERGAEIAQLRRRAAEATQSASGERVEDALVGDSPAMRGLRARLDALSESDDTTVLILGETGTGKGVVARVVHAKSRRAYEPFVAVDCTTIPVTLVESELFGHEKGAFSGATAAKPGRVETAARGTLFLDEIGELELPIQAKLLRLLEEREYTRVGGTRPHKLHARIVTATNRDLARASDEGRFRADLRYRLEVFVVELPPLRDRGDDVLVLAAHFARERARTLGRREPRIDDEVGKTLLHYAFPGNVRELRNMMEQAVLLTRGDVLGLEAFPVLTRRTSGVPRAPSLRASSAPKARSVAPPKPPTADVSAPPPAHLSHIRRARAEHDRDEALAALRASGGNVSAAARQLGVSRFRLLRVLGKHGLR